MLQTRPIPTERQALLRGEKPDEDWYRYWQSLDAAIRELQTAGGLLTTGDCWWSPLQGTRAGAVRMNARTIGNAASTATERANADTEALFTFLWTNLVDAVCPVSGGRGASAAADYAANKRIGLPDLRGRAPFGLDGMGNALAGNIPVAAIALNDQAGSTGGTALHTLTIGELPTHNHAVGTLTIGSESAHTHGIGSYVAANESAHTHGIGTYVAANESAHTHAVSGTSGAGSAHTHTMSGSTGAGSSHSHGPGTLATGNESNTHTHNIQTAGAAGATAVVALTTATVGATATGNASTTHTHNVTTGTTATESAHTHGIGTIAAGNESAHTHAISFTSGAGAAHTHTLSGTSGAGSAHTHTLSGTSGAGSAHTHTLTGVTGDVGSGTALVNLSPAMLGTWYIRL